MTTKESSASNSPVDYDVTDPGRKFFLPVTIVASVFCISLFAWLTADLGDPDVPIKKWIKAHGDTVILVETAVLAVVCFLAMYLDRQTTLKSLRERAGQAESASSGDSPSGENG
ncbi:MAG: hypothetical protein KDA88_19860 [Planctomycetaceae bacterium]|nr:hypothetical protein [Planctomycetaceae bacterium]MCB9949515.1 hypothetical protein [Planctomycetaceae bacterium]